MRKPLLIAFFLLIAPLGCAHPALLAIVDDGRRAVPEGQTSDVWIERDGQRQRAKVGMELERGDVIQVGEKVEAAMLRTDQGLLTVTRPTLLTLRAEGVRQDGGTVLYETDDEDLEVVTSSVTVFQTSAAGVVDLGSEACTITSLRGRMTVQPPPDLCAAVTLEPNQSVHVSEQGCLAKRPLGVIELQKKVREYNRLLEVASYDGTRIVPHAVGMTFVDAEAEVDAAGFDGRPFPVPDGGNDSVCVRREREPGDETKTDVEKTADAEDLGCVVAQSRPGGSRADKRSSVRLDHRQRAVDVPPVKGTTVDEARSRLEAVWLVVGTTHEVDKPTKSVKVGHVVRTEPDVGERVGEGRIIRLFVEPASTRVPDVKGETFEAANKRLVDRQLTVETVFVYEVGAKEAVRGLEPPADSLERLGTKVTLTVVRPGVAIPSGLEKMNASEALQALKRAGLVGRVKRAPSKDEAPDQVLFHDPVLAAAASNPVVVLTVSSGPKAE